MACVGHMTGVLGEKEQFHCPREKLHSSEQALKGQRRAGFQKQAHKTNGCKWPFPNLTAQ